MIDDGPAVAREGDLLAGWLAQSAEVERVGARFAELAGTLGQGVAVLTRSRLVFANAAMGGLLGIDPQALPETPLHRLVPDAMRRREVRAALTEAWQGGTADLRAVPITRGTGQRQPVSIALRALPRETEPTLLVVIEEVRAPEPGGPASGRPPAAARSVDALRALSLHLAGLANDLRGPLTAYLDHLATLELRADLPADIRESLGLYRAVTTESLGRLSRAMEWGRPIPLTEHVALAEIVRAAVSGRSEAHGGWIVLRLGAVPPILGLADQLQLAVEHLLRNAIEALEGRSATPPSGHGTIEIRLGLQAGRVVLTVKDDGPGIPPSLFPHVFEPFSSSKSIAAGLGLGLPIVQDIVGRHRGEVSIQSSSAGTTATLTFDPVVSDAGAARRGATRRVLIVDDNELVRQTFQAVMEAAGWEALAAADADEALQLAGRHPLSALLIDVQMSGRDGLAVVEALALWHPHLLSRVALHTGYADEERVRAAADRHGLALLQKPCSKERLVRTLTLLADRA